MEFCGDGIVQTGLGEACDDGNSDPFDACGNTCQFFVPVPSIAPMGITAMAAALGLTGALASLGYRRRSSR